MILEDRLLENCPGKVKRESRPESRKEAIRYKQRSGLRIRPKRGLYVTELIPR